MTFGITGGVQGEWLLLHQTTSFSSPQFKIYVTPMWMWERNTLRLTVSADAAYLKKQSSIYRFTNQSDSLTILAIQSTLGVNHPCPTPAEKRRSHRLLPVFLLAELPDRSFLFIPCSRIAGSTLLLLPDLQTNCPRIFLVTFRKLLEPEKPTTDSFRISR